MEDDFTYQLQAEAAAATRGGGEGEGEARTYTDPSDGTVYEWDGEKRAWFPKIDSEFLANYHAGYGFYKLPEEEKEKEGEKRGEDSIVTDTTTLTSKAEEEPETKKRKPSEPSWFDIDEAHNTNVYVSGLPLDVTEEEFSEHMSKCGIIMEDDEGHLKVKLYHDSEGHLKGDGLCCYLKVESVQLAIDLLDESEIRPGNTINVKRAQFQLKGAYNPSLRKKKHPKKKNKGGKQERLLDWRERKNDGGTAKGKHQKIIIFKYLFDPKEFEEDPTLITDIRDDLREECSKFGDVKKVLVFDRHVDGVGSVAFKEFESAEACISVMNGRYYGGKQLEVFHWDGSTNYQIEETEKEREQRLQQWEQFISSDKGEEREGKGEGEGGDNDPSSTTKDITLTSDSSVSDVTS